VSDSPLEKVSPNRARFNAGCQKNDDPAKYISLVAFTYDALWYLFYVALEVSMIVWLSRGLWQLYVDTWNVADFSTDTANAKSITNP